MTVRLVDTPLADPIGMPVPRAAAAPFDVLDTVYPASRHAAARLREPGALAVTTGQQPGLLTGPLYTLHKALSARAVARALESAWGRPVIPVFWAAGDDHDYAEASRAAWLAGDGSIARAALPDRPSTAPLTPLYREQLPAEVALVVNQFADTVTGSDRDAAVEWLRSHYRPGATFAAAFGGALAECLAPLGVVVVEGSAALLKRAAWPVLDAALRQAGPLDRALAERSARLTANGRAPGVRVGDGASLVMLEGKEGRDRLLPARGGFVTRRSGERFAFDELAAIAGDEPERLSANVLLRPVVESAVLPTVAYLAGPAELRYLALADALFEPLGVPRQLVLPRWSGLLVEPRVDRTLDKLRVTIDDLLADGAALDDRLARETLPTSFTDAAERLRAALDRGYEALTTEVVAIDPTLERPARSTRAHALHGIDELEKRVVQAARRRQAESLAQLERARNAIVPEGRPQERVLCLPGFLARYGEGVLQAEADYLDGWFARALEAPSPSS